MKKTGKVLILSFLLLLPALIYIFLRTFGQNEYDLPVLSSETTDSDRNATAGFEFPLSEIAGSSLQNWRGQTIDSKVLDDKIIVLDWVRRDEDPFESSFHVNRLSDIFNKNKNVHILRIFENDTGIKTDISGYGHDKRTNISFCFTGSDFNEFSVLSFSPADNELDDAYNVSGWNVILLDQKKMVRGFYNIYDFEEMDRLVLEIKILISRDKHV